MPNHTVERLDTLEQHVELLRWAFQHAEKSILITTYGINREALLHINFFRLVQSVQKRCPDLKIYIYSNDEKLIDKDIIDELQRCRNVVIAGTYTHSKILAIDRTMIAIGSFNWLAAISDRYGVGVNASIVYRGVATLSLIDDVWKYLRHWRNKQFENDFHVEQFEGDRKNLNLKVYAINDRDPQSELLYLTNLKRHQDFIRQCFQLAKKRIIIMSPFIHRSNFSQDFNSRNLRAAANKGVDVFFICLPEQIEKSRFNCFISDVNSRLRVPRIHLLAMELVHSKTFIVDDTIIAEGSFNWALATRDDSGKEAYNHETTLVVRGNAAHALIDGFYASALGKLLSPPAGTRRSRDDISAPEDTQPIKSKPQSTLWKPPVVAEVTTTPAVACAAPTRKGVTRFIDWSVSIAGGAASAGDPQTHHLKPK